MTGRSLLAALGAALLSLGLADAPRAASPLTPAEALAAIEAAPGLRVELVAAEPQVVDPVAARFDEHGRLWVVEMGDYPYGPAEGEQPRSRVRVLTDDDGDGYFESSQVFADELLFATGLQPWRGGVIVTLAGEVAYFQDTTGDGRADRREIWFRGFAEENPQLRANHPTLGPDGFVYIAGGLRGGKVVDLRNKGREPISIGGRDFRFDPRGDACEAITGNGQFGLTFDDFGRRFVCMNARPLDHVVLEQAYFRRNLHLAATHAVAEVTPGALQRRLYPLVDQWTTSVMHQGSFTAACGVSFHRGDALGAEYRGAPFICEPTGSLVHAEKLSPNGATFTSAPLPEGSEFLASRDPWHRPVNLCGGPDGALYVVDMYRAVIEHPEWMPSEEQHGEDLRHGDAEGRIYRVVQENAPRVAPRNLARMHTAELVDVMASTSDGWTLDTAARLLLERDDPAAVELILRVRAESSIARARLLQLLGALGGLNDEALLAALEDPDPRVREIAVKLSEQQLTDSAPLAAQVTALAVDSDSLVRFQVALALGRLHGESKLRALIEIAERGAGDDWMQAAMELSFMDDASNFVAAYLSEERRISRDAAKLLGFAAELAASSENDADAAAVLNSLFSNRQADLPTQLSILLGLARGLERGDRSLGDLQLRDSAETSIQLAEVASAARLSAADEHSDAALRELAVEWLARIEPETLLQLFASSEDLAVRVAVCRAMASHSAIFVDDRLIADFALQSPRLRREVLAVFAATPERTRNLLEMIAAGKIAAREVDAASAQTLVHHSDAEVRALARKLFGSPDDASRAELLTRYQPAADLSGDLERGRRLFREHCTACHRLEEVGSDVGPSIADLRTKSPEQVLAAILAPNAAIDANYVAYTALLVDGRVVSGVVRQETDAAVTLRQADGAEVSLLREEIDLLASTGASLMPEGLERQLDVPAMRDLITYLKTWRYSDSDGAKP